MAVNPITSESLTVDFRRLMSIPVGDRVRAASVDQNFVQSILTALTPIQIAKAFPDYFRRQLPDISNFVTSNIVARNGGVFNQIGGGDGGSAYPYYGPGNNISAGARPSGSELSVEQMKKKLLEKGIDVDGIYNAVGQNGLPEDDPSLKSIKGMSDDKLSEAGLQRITKPDGSSIIVQKASEVAALTDQEVSDRISGKFVAKENADEKQRAVIDFANRWNISPEAAAGVLKIESGVTSDIAGGAGGNYHGVFQLQSEQIAGLTQKAGFGVLTPEQYRKLSVADQLKVMDEYYKQAGITPEFFTGDPTTDASKMWAIQLAPSNAKSIDYTDPNAVISNTQQAPIIRQGGTGAVTVGSAGAGSVAGGQEFLSQSFERIEGNATPEQISKARIELAKEERQKRLDALTKKIFNKASPTSSDAAVMQSSISFKDIELNAADYNVRSDGSTLGPKERRAIREQGGITINLDNNAAADYSTSSFNPMIVIPDDATDEQIAAASAYVNTVAEAYNNRFGTNLKGKVVTRGQNGRGRTDTIHTEPFNIRDKAGIDYFYNTEEGQAALAKITASTLGQIPGANFQLPHGGLEGKDKGASGDLGSEVDLATKLLSNLSNIKEELQKQKESASVAPAPAEQPVPQMALGGNIYGVNEDITLVNTKTGEPIAQVNDNERIEKQGNAIQVTPETKLKADELTQKYDTSSEIEDRMNNIENRVDQQQEISTQNIRKATAPEKVQTESPMKWREAVAAGERPVSPSFSRAMARTKFFPEGHHFNRSSPSSQS